MSPETLLMVIVGVFVTAYLAIWLLVRSWERVTPPADPWDKETGEAIKQADAQPVCHRCFTPLSARDYECPNCGASEGVFSNWLPFPQIFAIGEVLRNGVAPGRKLGALSVVGYVLLALNEYACLAPFYLWLLYRRQTARPRDAKTVPPEPPPGPQ